jgi:hypothetical protein
MVNGENHGLMALDGLLTTWLPCRIDAIEAMRWALALRNRARHPAPVELTVAGGLRFRGNVGLLTNAMIEVGYAHIRALLKFMGIGARNGALVDLPRAARRARTPDGSVIEDYMSNGRRLDRVGVEQLYAAIDLPRAVAEWVVVAIFETGTDNLSRATTREAILCEVDRHAAAVGAAILALLKVHVYEKLEPGQYDRYRAPNWAD